MCHRATAFNVDISATTLYGNPDISALRWAASDFTSSNVSGKRRTPSRSLSGPTIIRENARRKQLSRQHRWRFPGDYQRFGAGCSAPRQCTRTRWRKRERSCCDATTKTHDRQNPAARCTRHAQTVTLKTARENPVLAASAGRQRGSHPPHPQLSQCFGHDSWFHVRKQHDAISASSNLLNTNLFCQIKLHALFVQCSF